MSNRVAREQDVATRLGNGSRTGLFPCVTARATLLADRFRGTPVPDLQLWWRRLIGLTWLLAWSGLLYLSVRPWHDLGGLVSERSRWLVRFALYAGLAAGFTAGEIVRGPAGRRRNAAPRGAVGTPRNSGDDCAGCCIRRRSSGRQACCCFKPRGATTPSGSC